MQTNTFPRASGHCFSHHIPADVVTLKEEHVPRRSELDRALVYLRKQKADLVKGDLVVFDCCAGYRNTGVVIFDGEALIDLSEEPDDYGTLPMNFRVIEGGIPIDYWSWNDDTDESRGIAHNSIVWFDHSAVLEQCLQNITYGVVNGDKHAIFTTFDFNGKTYRIVFDYVDELMADEKIDLKSYKFHKDSTKDKFLAKFHEALSKTDELLAFNFGSEFYEELPGDTTLYLQYYSPVEHTTGPIPLPILSIMGLPRIPSPAVGIPLPQILPQPPFSSPPIPVPIPFPGTESDEE